MLHILVFQMWKLKILSITGLHANHWFDSTIVRRFVTVPPQLRGCKLNYLKYFAHLTLQTFQFAGTNELLILKYSHGEYFKLMFNLWRSSHKETCRKIIAWFQKEFSNILNLSFSHSKRCSRSKTNKKDNTKKSAFVLIFYLVSYWDNYSNSLELLCHLR